LQTVLQFLDSPFPSSEVFIDPCSLHSLLTYSRLAWSSYRMYCDSPILDSILADDLASRKSESVSPTSSSPISVLPANFDRIDAGVNNCSANLSSSIVRNCTRESKHGTHLREVLTP
jgi:hypothetical protein